ncbi:phage portal protein [Frisingicoccus sp.]|uniref:phage portal protein n=1 Tax=Frisingicoccus sp. TaxID=1918627 RepID=UPI0025BFB95C|nr:phage portal protein [Frisingicoccus sp.]
MLLNFGIVDGLPEEEQEKLNKLKYIYDYHKSSNRKKRRYYNGKITLKEVNLGIALPRDFGRLEIGCAWGAKAVDVLAARSMFDGFVMQNGSDASEMDQIMKRNRLVAEYSKACKEELKYGSVYAAVSGSEGKACIRFYSPMCAAASWDNQKGTIDCGFAFEDLRTDESDYNWSPSHVNFYTDTDIWQLDMEGGRWKATQYPHKFRRPLMVPMIWDATNDKPLGQSRLKEPIRRLIQGYVRTVANATIGLEFATSPQKYLLGITDEQYDALVEQRFKQYVGSILFSTTNPESGEKPTYGQLNQGNIEPHVQMLRMIATQFSAATGLTVTDTGVVNDANPTSSDAILAQSQTLVLMAQQLNTGNADALYQISQMALAIELGTTPDDLPYECKEIVAHFKNPAMPSVAVTADAAIKIASARDGFSSTDTFLEMIGFDQADIRRIKAQEQRARGARILTEEFTANEDIE